ncbi:alcohol dehydrogenase [Capsulimonas corticalis]|uniref:Alcohol dehydrogenase n=1 Tax=Capsulimonas corticalis TaxID=2219043 RepID=A0A402CRF1_9BACT|nr:zinc-binding dehydrogenase [Capsulimonas corticalis]BDI28085.1 alcohol dehydrogenase [Capsulimonas corticalis]
MKAARLEHLGAALKVENIGEPQLRAGGAIVRILAARVASYTDQVISGELGFTTPTPCTLGPTAIGVIEAIADDVFGLSAGQTVFCDAYIGSRTIGVTSDRILIGWTGLGPDAGRTQSIWRDGSFAEKALWPAECLTPIPDDLGLTPEALTYLGYSAIAYGGLIRGGLHSGQAVIVNGATGSIGASAVLLALAMGAAKIVAVGRDGEMLDQLRKLAPKRIAPVSLDAAPEVYTEELRRVAGGADLLLDVLGKVTTAAPTLAGIHALRRGGTAVFVGGVHADIPLPYSKIMLEELTIRGSFMYPKHAPSEIINMAQAGILDLSPIRPRTFALDDIDNAIAQAKDLRGFEYAVLVP